MVVAALDNPVDLLVLLVIAVLIFGKRLPEVARSVGKGIRELKESVNMDDMSDTLNTVNEIRSAVSPSRLVRAAVPGVAEFHSTLGAADALNPLSSVEPSEAQVEWKTDSLADKPVADGMAEEAKPE